MLLVVINQIKGVVMANKVGPGSAIQKKKSCKFIVFACGLLSLVTFWGNESQAVPAFARKYHTACSTCHLAFPVRNGFGEAFRNNGYRFPGGTDDEMIKEEPIALGQESYKKVFPDAIWPSDIPNMPSLGFLASATVTVPKDRFSGNYKNTNFAEELGVFFAGTVDHHISYFGDFAMNDESAKLGRLVMLWTFRPGVNLALGDVGFPELFTLISARPNGDKDSYSTSLPNPNRGVELRIAGDTGESGGYSLLAGVGRNNSPFNTTASTGENQGGHFADTKYARATFKVGGNGLLSGVGGTLGQNAIGQDNAVTFGLNYFNSSRGGEAPPTDIDEANSHTIGRSKSAYAADIVANYGQFRTVAQYARFNEVIDFAGVDWGKRTAFAAEADYWIYPWLFGAVRYEHVKDNLNGKINKFIPGVAALIRANAKVGIEYVAVSKDALAESNSIAGNSFSLYTQLGF